MSQQFIDGFDNYNTPASIYDAVSSGTMNASFARFSAATGCVSQGIQIGIGSSHYNKKTLLSSQSTLIIGFALNGGVLPSGGNGLANILAIYDGVAGMQTSLTINGSGQFQFRRGNALGTLIGPQSSIGSYAPNTWYGLIAVITVSSTVGQVTLYLNGNSTPIINSSANLNTQATSATTANQFAFGNIDSGSGGADVGNSSWDDVWVWDTTGSTQNSFPNNDPRVLTKLPSSAGFYTNWTPNGLGSNYQCVSQNPPNSSDYVYNNLAGTKDSYSLTTTGLVVSPLSLAIRQSISKDDGLTHTAQGMVRSNSIDLLGSAYNVNSSYTFVDTVFTSDPNTSAPWTATAADAVQIGVVETS